MALSIAYWATYVDGQRKLTRKSEAAVESDRVLKFVFDKEYRVINSSVQASMRDTSYKVQVSALHMYPPQSCHFAVQMFVSSLNFISVINEPYQRHMIRTALFFTVVKDEIQVNSNLKCSKHQASI